MKHSVDTKYNTNKNKPGVQCIKKTQYMIAYADNADYKYSLLAHNDDL